MKKCNCMSPGMVARIERQIDEEIYRQTNGEMGKPSSGEINPKALKLPGAKPVALGPLKPMRILS
jgi:hypothetical protein